MGSIGKKDIEKVKMKQFGCFQIEIARGIWIASRTGSPVKQAWGQLWTKRGSDSPERAFVWTIWGTTQT